MDFFDFIRELRKGSPDIKKAEKSMKILGWICLAGAVWNLLIHYIAPLDERIFNLLPQEPYISFITLLVLGIVFFKAAQGIRQMEPWGRKIGQIAIIVLIGSFSVFMVYVVPKGMTPTYVFFVFMVIIVAQFAVPAYFGIRYLGRLPVKDGSYAAYQYREEAGSRTLTEQTGIESSMSHVKYMDSPSRLGIYGTFALLLAIPILIGFLIGKYYGEEALVVAFFPSFLFIFLSPIVYNYFPSPFQDGRTLVASFTGGGSIFLFGGSWPFFRLLVYEDSVEVRAMFHRYLIPYDKMEDIPDKVGFFTRGILIKSNLPKVPSGIRFQGFGIKKIVSLLNNMRSKYLAANV